jgi:hypothetical protein
MTDAKQNQYEIDGLFQEKSFHAVIFGKTAREAVDHYTVKFDPSMKVLRVKRVVFAGEMDTL